MTSTASPTTSPEDVLSDQQRERAAALVVARTALSARVTSGLTASTQGAVDASDLLRVAGWIVTGSDPWGLDKTPTDEEEPPQETHLHYHATMTPDEAQTALDEAAGRTDMGAW